MLARILAVCALAAALALACNGGGTDSGANGNGSTAAPTSEPTPTFALSGDYWADLQSLQDRVNTQIAALSLDYPSAATDPRQATGLLRASDALSRDAFAELDQFSPPADVQALHDAYIDAGLALVDTLDELAADLEALPPDGDPTLLIQESGLFGGPSPDPRYASFSAACDALEGAGLAAGEPVDLDCP